GTGREILGVARRDRPVAGDAGVALALPGGGDRPPSRPGPAGRHGSDVRPPAARPLVALAGGRGGPLPAAAGPRRAGGRDRVGAGPLRGRPGRDVGQPGLPGEARAAGAGGAQRGGIPRLAVPLGRRLGCRDGDAGSGQGGGPRLARALGGDRGRGPADRLPGV
ncbi:MAG: hypothetical protein AVDCRST_MAG59-1757, partial [uncultured Thermomicrobiales bacterium]